MWCSEERRREGGRRGSACCLESACLRAREGCRRELDLRVGSEAGLTECWVVGRLYSCLVEVGLGRHDERWEREEDWRWRGSETVRTSGVE